MALVRVKVGVHSNVKQRLARVVLDADHLNGGYTAVGWGRDEKYPNGTSVARVALFNEFGTHNANGSVRNPARPFMRPAYRNNRGALLALQITVIRDVLAQKITPERALNILGYRMWQWVRSAILSNTPPPLAPRTLAAKRRAGRPGVTLIDTRRMLDTLGYKIYIGGRGRPPMKDDPSPAGSSPGGGSPTIKPQHQPGGGRSTSAPKANEHPSARAVSNIPRVMTPDEIRREKKALQDELRRAKGKPKPGGTGKPPKGRPTKTVGVKKEKQQDRDSRVSAPTQKSAPGSPTAKSPSPNKKAGRRVTRAGKVRRRVAKSARKVARKASTKLKRAGKTSRRFARKSAKALRRTVQRVTKTARRVIKKVSRVAKKVAKAVKKGIKRTAAVAKKLRRAVRQISRQARKLIRLARRNLQAFSKLERTLLRNIITLARAASRYGRSL